MAIDRRDYQYVRNTLSGYGKGRADDEEVDDGVARKIGDKVENLLPDLYDGMKVYSKYDMDKPNDAKAWYKNESITLSGTHNIAFEVRLTRGSKYVMQIFNSYYDNSNGYYSDGAFNSWDSVFVYFIAVNDNITIVSKEAVQTYNHDYPATFEPDINNPGVEYESVSKNNAPQVKIFLFRAELPFVVDREGVVVGIMPCMLKQPN